MRTSEAGNNVPLWFRRIAPGPGPLREASSRCSASRRQRGFTLIELLVVVAIIAIGSAGVVFAMRDGAAIQLEREAQRLAALLESARAQSRASGQAVRWRVAESGFRFEGVAKGSLPEHWLTEGTQAVGSPVLLLGPEPIIGPQEVVIEAAGQRGRTFRVATDGLRPFAVTSTAAP